MTQSILITTEMTALELELPDRNQLDALYESIGCTNVEVVTFEALNVSSDMWCDGEALFDVHPQHNFVASVMAERPIYGDVVITGAPTVDGEITDIDPRIARFLGYSCKELARQHDAWKVSRGR